MGPTFLAAGVFSCCGLFFRRSRITNYSIFFQIGRRRKKGGGNIYAIRRRQKKIMVKFSIRRGRKNNLAPFAIRRTVFLFLLALSSLRRGQKLVQRRFSVFAAIVYSGTHVWVFAVD